MNDGENAAGLDALLASVRDGAIGVDEAAGRLRAMQAQPLGFATVDHHRAHRCGTAEVIFAAGKTPEQVASIAGVLLERSPCVLVTRGSAEQLDHVESALPGTPIRRGQLGGTAILGRPPVVAASDAGEEGVDSAGRYRPIPIVTAGTSDLPVAEEAAMTCAALGHPVASINDVGVAGIHRVLHRADEVRAGHVVIVIAGMEGALPSVVGGLVDSPVIAVPTSVGYGASFGGIAALLGMLNSCASGVTVVNIDNGFGAAYAACRVNKLGGRSAGSCHRGHGGAESTE
ncbi:MAG: nickel pincer cofactor biosynthesis protein LarB [Phycisphaerales bacterium JB063]